MLFVCVCRTRIESSKLKQKKQKLVCRWLVFSPLLCLGSLLCVVLLRFCSCVCVWYCSCVDSLSLCLTVSSHVCLSLLRNLSTRTSSISSSPSRTPTNQACFFPLSEHKRTSASSLHPCRRASSAALAAAPSPHSTSSSTGHTPAAMAAARRASTDE